MQWMQNCYGCHNGGVTLRDRKRAKTRQALVQAAAELFEERGYNETTVAQIAAAADIGTRTFFSYFASKEDLLFPESDDRVRVAVDLIAKHRALEGPAEVLLRALRQVSDDSDDLGGRLAALRLRLIRTVPAVQGKALQMQFEAQRQIARHLAEAYPEQLDPIGAAALTGAFVGAISGALEVLLADAANDDDPAAVQRALQVAVDRALAPWFREPAAARPSG
jgi:AcrR family transcriptional regulator